ncbi:hypothetical protein V7266_30455 [Neobacillus drentensis]|uniref:hypothetical protein n=1 Tax=Neobacillus drentensis TaxID=220684 RepID=UPI002FFFB46C
MSLIKMKNRVGEINENNYLSTMEIVEYNGALDVVVKFDNDKLVHTSYNKFKKGQVRNPYDPSVCEVGYLGEGKHKASENGKQTKVYVVWYSMLNRAYSEKFHKRQSTYKEVTVCQEWWNFQNFAEWFYENYYEIDNEPISLDKDILVKGNKVYSAETCVFVPDRLNTLIVNCNSARGSLPIGVTFNKITKKYQTQCANGKGEVVPLGHYNSPEEAFEVYKQFKENVIKQVVSEYQNKIPNKLYHSLYSWKIEIDD